MQKELKLMKPSLRCVESFKSKVLVASFFTEIGLLRVMRLKLVTVILQKLVTVILQCSVVRTQAATGI
jgi:hypothetical protein